MSGPPNATHETQRAGGSDAVAQPKGLADESVVAQRTREALLAKAREISRRAKERMRKLAG